MLEVQGAQLDAWCLYSSCLFPAAPSSLLSPTVVWTLQLAAVACSDWQQVTLSAPVSSPELPVVPHASPRFWLCFRKSEIHVPFPSLTLAMRYMFTEASTHMSMHMPAEVLVSAVFFPCTQCYFWSSLHILWWGAEGRGLMAAHWALLMESEFSFTL